MKLPVDDRLDSILDVAPDATKAATRPPTVIEQAANILQGELVVATTDAALVVVPVVPPEPVPAVVPAPAVPPDPHVEQLNADMDIARTNMQDVIDQGKAALTSALEMAEDSQAPRAYEVVATMISAIVAANKELINIHKVRKDTLKTDKETKQVDDSLPSGGIRIDKAVFVGRAQDLLRTLKDVEKEVSSAS